jgi:hypothetical protein
MHRMQGAARRAWVHPLNSSSHPTIAAISAIAKVEISVIILASPLQQGGPQGARRLVASTKCCASRLRFEYSSKSVVLHFHNDELLRYLRVGFLPKHDWRRVNTPPHPALSKRFLFGEKMVLPLSNPRGSMICKASGRSPAQVV